MVNYKTQIRLSQFITTYGVGSLIELPDTGPCIILSLKHSGLFNDEKTPNNFLLSNLGTSRLSKMLRYCKPKSHILWPDKHDKIGIFELPSNASYGKPADDEIIYQIKRFPNYSLCMSENHSGYGILYWRFGPCPVCPSSGKTFSNKSDRNTIRFVSICPRGHIEDVNWRWHVHKKTNIPCNREYYLWKQTKTGEIKISCSLCEKSTTLTNIIMGEQFCRGFYPEEVVKAGYEELSKQKKQEGWSCDQKTQVVPRNSTSVFIPETITAITTPLEANEFYKILNYNPVAKLLKDSANESPPKPHPNLSEVKIKIKDVIQEIDKKIQVITGSSSRTNDPIEKRYLEKLNLDKKKPKQFLDIIKEYKKDPSEVQKVNNLIKDFYENFLLKKEGLSEEEFRREELKVFLRELTYDHYPDFKRSLVIDFDHANHPVSYKNLRFRVTPIPKLEVVIVQQGYKRICSAENLKIVPTPYIDEENDNNNWYPGVRLQGEGIFIELCNLLGELDFGIYGENWLELYELMKRYEKFLQLEEENSKTEVEKPNTNKEKSKETKERESKQSKNDEALKEAFKEIESNKYVKNIKEKDYKFLSNWLDKLLFRKVSGLFLHPLGVWWHTLSHRLIKAIATDCGYTLASIRERLYITKDEGKLRAGLLLYSARPGMDGTMGGLIYQVPRFKRILERALEGIDLCSNDPICSTTELYNGNLNGAACYVCQFLPETSCEFGNMGLDRNVLKNSLK